jgi:hypothetical protein
VEKSQDREGSKLEESNLTDEKFSAIIPAKQVCPVDTWLLVQNLPYESLFLFDFIYANNIVTSSTYIKDNKF